MKLAGSRLLSKPQAASLSLVSFLALQTSVSACGGFFCQPQQPVLQAGENIAFGVRQNADMVAVDMAVQINYEGPAEDFAWILPVPVQPKISTGSDLLFSGLFAATRPTFSFQVNNDGTNCSEEQLFEQPCANFGGVANIGAPESGGDADDNDEAIVLEEGTVGPFEFVTLEAAEGNPESVYEWLNENGYDQPEEAEEPINTYAGMGMKFVALRLLKDSDSGLIRPVVLQYEIAGTLGDSAFACVPIELTAIAATPAMPIQIYLLSEHRGVAFNYVDLEIDFRLIDWLGCQFGGQNCYLNSLRALVDAAAMVANGHAVITEFAGPTMGAITGDTVAVRVDLNTLSNTADPLEFLNMLLASNVPGIPLVHTIIERYIPNRYQPQRDEEVPFPCEGLVNVYTPGTPWQMGMCVRFIDFDGSEFDPMALASDLDTEVFQPAADAQTWVESYGYLSRLYAELDPEEMDKDPLFVFNKDLPDVSNQISAIGRPYCDGLVGPPVALDIYIDNPNDFERVEATLSCGQYIGNGGFVFDGTMNPALSMTGFGLEGEESSTVLRDPATGQFVVDEVQALISVLDDRAPAPMLPDGVGTTPPESDDEVSDDKTSDDSGVTYVGLWGTLMGAVVATSSLFW